MGVTNSLLWTGCSWDGVLCFGRFSAYFFLRIRQYMSVVILCHFYSPVIRTKSSGLDSQPINSYASNPVLLIMMHKVQCPYEVLTRLWAVWLLLSGIPQHIRPNWTAIFTKTFHAYFIKKNSQLVDSKLSERIAQKSEIQNMQPSVNRTVTVSDTKCNICGSFDRISVDQQWKIPTIKSIRAICYLTVISNAKSTDASKAIWKIERFKHKFMSSWIWWRHSSRL